MRSKKATKPRSTLDALGVRVEKFDLLKSLAQALAGLTFGHLARGDADGLKADLRKILAGRVRNTALPMSADSAPHRHQMVLVQEYSQPTYALLDSGALPNIMSKVMAETLNITLKPNKQSIRAASGSAEPCVGVEKMYLSDYGT